MKHVIYRPQPILSNYIKFYWSLEGQQCEFLDGKERIFPDGCIELIFYYGDVFKINNHKNRELKLPTSFINGQLTRYIEIEPTGKIGIIGVKFQPGGLKKFINFDVNELTDAVVSIKNLWGSDGRIVEDKILCAGSNERRILILEQFLICKLSEQKRIHYQDDYAGVIVRSNGLITSTELSAKFSISKRQLERRFKSEVGMTPKYFSRIIRFQNMLLKLKDGESKNLVSLAYDFGFYDQAHFIKDFINMTGFTPRKFVSEHLTKITHFD